VPRSSNDAILALDKQRAKIQALDLEPSLIFPFPARRGGLPSCPLCFHFALWLSRCRRVESINGDTSCDYFSGQRRETACERGSGSALWASSQWGNI